MTTTTTSTGAKVRTTTTSTGAKVRTATAAATAAATATATATAPVDIAALGVAAGMDPVIAAMVAGFTNGTPLIPATATAAAMVDPLASARAEFATALGDAHKSTDRWTESYAAALNEHLPIEWWTFDHKAECADGKATRREQKATYSALKTAGYSNPSVAWKRVRNAAAVLKGWVDCETEEEEEEEVEATEADKVASKYQKIQALIADAIKKLGKLDADHSTDMQALADTAKRLPSL